MRNLHSFVQTFQAKNYLTNEIDVKMHHVKRDELAHARWKSRRLLVHSRPQSSSRLRMTDGEKLSLPLIRQLRLYLDDNAVLRCRGRLESDQSKFPVLLPRNEHFTKLVSQAAHMQVHHSGVRKTLTQLRQKYWVPRGRQFVRSLIRKCVTCRKTDGPPYRSVSSPPLPTSRVSEG